MLRSTWRLLLAVDPQDATTEANRRAFLRMCVVMSVLCAVLIVAAFAASEGLRLLLDVGAGVVMASSFFVASRVALRRRLRLAAWIASMGMIQPLLWGDLVLGTFTEKLYFLPAGVILAGFGLESRTMWLAFGVMTACLAGLVLGVGSPLPLGVEFNPTLVLDVLVLTVGLTAFMHTFVRSTRAAQDAARAQLHEANLHRRRAEAAASEALVASNSKSMFLANVSHELRTPLNAILGYAELLQEEAQEQRLDAFDADLQHIHRAATHLSHVINDILDLSRIEAGRLDVHPDPFALKDLLDELIATMTPLAERGHNSLHLALHPDLSDATLHTDRTRLRQILLNLLSNACKFTQKGEVSLAVERATQDGQRVIRFIVRDTGVGMDDALQARLFEPFVQASTSTVPGRQPGTGLGLVITRRILHLLGGDVEVQSQPGQGSTFAAWVPETPPGA